MEIVKQKRNIKQKMVYALVSIMLTLVAVLSINSMVLASEGGGVRRLRVATVLANGESIVRELYLLAAAS